MKTINNISDHDLLIKLDTKFDILSADVKTMGDGLGTRVTKLENWREQEDVYHAKIDFPWFQDQAKWVETLRDNLKFIAPLGFILLGFIAEVFRIIIQKWLGI